MGLTKEQLENYGFSSIGDNFTFSKRVHERIFLEYDTCDGFVTIVRFLEIPKHNTDRVKIIFPHKIDTESKLKSLTDIFTGNF